MVTVYIKERINDQTTICSGGVTGNTTYPGTILCWAQDKGNVGSGDEIENSLDLMRTNTHAQP